MTLQNLTDLGYKTLPHPPYFPDLSPSNCIVAVLTKWHRRLMDTQICTHVHVLCKHEHTEYTQKKYKRRLAVNQHSDIKWRYVRTYHQRFSPTTTNTVHCPHQPAPQQLPFFSCIWTLILPPPQNIPFYRINWNCILKFFSLKIFSVSSYRQK